MNIIPPSRATTASRPTAITCAGLRALVTLAARSLRALTSRAMSDLHPHDLLVRLDRSVADAGGQLLDLLEAGGEVDLAGAGRRAARRARGDRRQRRDAGADGGDAHECLP